MIFSEIGIIGDNNHTYLKVNENENDILQRQTTFLNTFSITIPTKGRTFPFIYWLPKFHKNPVKARYIFSSSVCITKQIASLVSKALKLIMKGRKKYCSAIEEFTGTSRWWVVDNNQAVLELIKQINDKRQAKSVVT